MTSESMIKVSLIFTSNTLSLERMVDVLPFAPTETWHCGDAVGKSMIRRKHNGVVLALPQEVGDHLEPVVLKLLDVVEPIKEHLIHATTNELIDCELSCVAYSTQSPSINFSPKTIKRVCDLNAYIDVDVIIC
jgi:Domain of unknown function (DUF4279)